MVKAVKKGGWWTYNCLRGRYFGYRHWRSQDMHERWIVAQRKKRLAMKAM